jgi:hypothetical protein
MTRFKSAASLGQRPGRLFLRAQADGEVAEEILSRVADSDGHRIIPQ